MQTKFIKTFYAALASLLTFGFLGCGVGLDDQKGPNPELAQQNQALMQSYKSIEGVYSVSVENKGSGLSAFPANLVLYADTIKEEGIDDDGQPKARVVLRGRLVRSDIVGESDNLVLIGTYNRMSGDLDLKPDNTQKRISCDAGARVYIEVKGRVSGRSFQGQITREGRTWAFATGNLESRDVVAQAQKDEQEDFNRIREMYLPVVGTYEGTLSQQNSAGSIVTEDVKFLVFVVEVQQKDPTDTGEICFRPQLYSRFMRMQKGENDDVRSTYNRFYPEKKELLAVSEGFMIDAKVAEKSLVGPVYSKGTFWGQLTLFKKSPEANLPAEGDEQLERERRLRTFREVIGEYRGKAFPDSGSTPYPIGLKVYIVEEQQIEVGNGEGDGKDKDKADISRGSKQPIFLPALRARYRRLDFMEGIGERFLQVRYYTEAGAKKLFMFTRQGGGSEMGVGMLSFSGEFKKDISGDFKKDKITGEASDQKGPLGRVDLSRFSSEKTD
ncbi:MAG: hypothetical protein AB7O96_02805 [Pseudobdellovibrionaceae bacterium]